MQCTEWVFKNFALENPFIAYAKSIVHEIGDMVSSALLIEGRG
jgi:hypothetical protein